MPLPKEAVRFWEQALEDFDAARFNSKGGKFFVAAFLCQQAVEKALKAVYIARMREPPPTTHSLIHLANLVEAPRSFRRFLKELTMEYVVARYPNATDEIPARLYDAELLEDYLARTQEVLEWVREILGM